MAKVPVYNQTGERVSDLALSDNVFGVPVDMHLLEQSVRTYRSGLRAPISSTLTRAEVRGGGRKPWKQKGTGRARHGSIRSPLWKGGGVTFGPRSTRNWRIKMNKRAARLALFMALSDKVSSKSVIILDKLELPEGKSKMFARSIKELLAGTGASPRKTLLIIAESDENLERAGKNLAEVKVVRAGNLNIYDVINANTVIILQDALSIIEKIFGTYITK